jgi:NAD(P)-dependent dehydrogenase (short-subunit alcohol dehydrogenase family)
MSRIALVTGAGQGMIVLHYPQDANSSFLGIGRDIALRLAGDGLDIAVNDLSSQVEHLESLVAEIRGLGRKSIYVFADISSEEDVKAMIDTVVEQLGGLDVVSSDLTI